MKNAIINLLNKRVCTLDEAIKEKIATIIDTAFDCDALDIAIEISDLDYFSQFDADIISAMIEEFIIGFQSKEEGVTNIYKNHLGWFVDTGFKDEKIYGLEMLNDEIEKLLETKIKSSMILNMPHISQIHDETCSRIEFLKLVRKSLIDKINIG